MPDKPIKRNKHLMPVSREHHYSLLFCWKIRIGIKSDVDIKRISDYVAYFWEHFMKQHFQEEEVFLFMDKEDNLVQKAILEHEQIKEQIAFILKREAVTTQHLLRLADMTDLHVRFEERVLFPHLEKTLPALQLANVDKHFTSDAGRSQDNYPDEFWVKEQAFSK